jgi:hypothetical protein
LSIKSVSQQFYANVVENSSDAKRLVSLERIKAACDALEKQTKAKAYTVADIGRHCDHQWGGPKAQSIRNAPDVLEKYVKLRAAEFAERLTATPNATNGKKGLNLADPALAQQQYMLALAEVAQLTKEVARLKVDIGLYAPMTTDQLLEAAKNGGPAESSVEVLSAIPADVLSAIRSLFNPDRLRGCELSLDPNGYLINEVSGNELLTASEVSSLKSLL